MIFDSLLYKYIYGMLSLLIIMLTIILVYSMNGYGYFTVNMVVVSGNNVVARDEILKRSRLVIGESSTFFLDKTLEKELIKNSWIRNVKVNKFLPNYIQIVLDEEKIFSLLKDQNGKLKYINQYGKQLGDANIKLGLDFPVIIRESNIEENSWLIALELLKISKTDSELNFSDISEVYYSSISGITVVTTQGTIIYFGKGYELGERWNSLRDILLYSEYSNFKQQYIDLSFDEKIVVKYDL